MKSFKILPLLFLLSGCIVPLEYACHSLEYQKDVSDDPERGYIIGKTYQLKANLNLFRIYNSNNWSLSPFIVETLVKDKNGNLRMEVSRKLIPEFEIAKQGIQIIIVKVLVEANRVGGVEYCGQTILASIVREQGDTVFANVSDLFENTNYSPDEKWVFTPKPNFLEEVID